jgi:hypothetical protein
VSRGSSSLRPRAQRSDGGLSRVYASLPLTGAAGSPGREVLRGAELALERSQEADVELIALGSFGEDREALAVANARRAADDPRALAYLGDFHSSQVMETAPVLGDAGVLQVAPVATFVGLHGATLVRLVPHDGVGARAMAVWLVDAGVRELLVVHDHDVASRSATARRPFAPRARRATATRSSARYSLDEHGHTTCTEYGRYAVVNGELVWDRSGASRT